MGLVSKVAKNDSSHFDFCSNFIQDQLKIIGETKKMPSHDKLEFNFFKALKYDIRNRRRMEVIRWFNSTEQHSQYRILHPGYQKWHNRIKDYVHDQRWNLE